jgi:TRAP-type C4-dicarboxylate transport system substrate-binding protein
MSRLLALALLLASAPAIAQQPIVLRYSTPAPEGTGWARELRAYASDVAAATHDAVHLKWYFGAVTGDEFETLDRIRKGQLDAIGSGGMGCEQIMPSISVTRLLGVFQSREEAFYVGQTLRSVFEQEARKNGFELLALNGMGADVVFTREPVRNLDELRKLKLWRWDLDKTGTAMATMLGLKIKPLPLTDAAAAYDHGELQGFMSIPAAALAFQWTARAHYVLDLKTGFLEGCLLISSRTFGKLTTEQQASLRETSTKLGLRWEAFGRDQDALLLGGVLSKQGVKVLRASESFRAQFFNEAGAVRERLVQTNVIPRALLDRVMQVLADYRAEHGSSAATP